MIVYCVICRAKDAAVLVELSSPDLKGNAPQVTTALLEQLRDHPQLVQEGDLKTYVNRSSNNTSNGNNEDNENNNDIFSHVLQACTTIAMTTVTQEGELDLGNIQEHFFHLWNSNGIFYCCLSDDAVTKDQKVNFAFLQALDKEFTASFNKRRIQNANAYSLDKSFRPTVVSTMHYYNTHHNELSRDVQVNALLTQVEDMKAIMGRNIVLLLEREVKLNRLVNKSEQMKRDSMVFKKRAQQVNKQNCWKSYKLSFLIAGMIVLISYTIMAASCGFTMQRCLATGSGGDGGDP